jgi:hypothetical protein
MEKKKKKNKRLKAKVYLMGAFLFWHSRHLVGVSVLRIDRCTIKRVKLVVKCRYQSATRCSNSLYMHLDSSEC